MNPTLDWTVVVPVKGFATAKSRLSAGPRASALLAAAFLTDTLDAVRSTPAVHEVLVATGDGEVAAIAEAVGATVVDDAGHAGINAAARHAARNRRGTGGVAIVVSDLPCLTPAALSLALELAGDHRTAFLGDLDGSGTTMWFAPQGRPVRPAFGAHSRAMHLAAGDADLVALHPQSWAGLEPARRDVDTDTALERARMLGVGRACRGVLAPTT